jgi:LmbE family N-acetylglucosaminyl deacetylase
MARKLSALGAHRSQFGTDEALRTPPREIAQMLEAFRSVFETESFVMGATRRPVARWPLADPFDGLFDRAMQARLSGLHCRLD